MHLLALVLKRRSQRHLKRDHQAIHRHAFSGASPHANSAWKLTVDEKAPTVVGEGQVLVGRKMASASTGQYDEALLRASQLIAQAPWFAEAWNQRAIAHSGLRRFEESIRDCYQVLDINPYHFGAAAGMGQCHLDQKDPISALESFRRALKINPDLEGVRAQVVRLQRALRRD